MTPYEFGCRVKLAVETGGLFEWMGQGADNGVKSFNNGVQSFNKAIGLPQFNPQAFGGSVPPGLPTAAPAAPKVYKTVDQMAGPSPSRPAPPPTPQTPKVYKTVDQMAGPSPSRPARPAPPLAAPRPAAAPVAPAQPKPSAPGVRKPSGRVI